MVPEEGGMLKSASKSTYVDVEQGNTLRVQQRKLQLLLHFCF